jgi:L-gulonolactone oxidase
MFKRSLTYVIRNDSDFADQAVSFGLQHEFADLAWYPGQREVKYRRDNRVPVNVSGSGTFEFIGFRQTATAASQVTRFTGIHI